MGESSGAPTDTSDINVRQKPVPTIPGLGSVNLLAKIDVSST